MLRSLARKYGNQLTLDIIHGNANSNAVSMDDSDEIVALTMEILNTKDVQKIEPDTLLQILKPNPLLERFSARMANKIGQTRDFLTL
jgi:hypothetical protein